MTIPGFVDLQVNGYKGVDFSSPNLTEEDFTFACRALLDNGTAALLPTIITSPLEVFERNLRLMSQAVKCNGLEDRLLGFHVEGPFLSAAEGARGAHNADWIRRPNIDLLDQMQNWSGGTIKLITVAADVEGAAELCRHATENLGITVSLGHHLATAEDLEKMSQAGARALTHLGNGVPKQLHRHHNPIWAGLANDRLTAMIITDGHHLPDTIIKTVIRAKGIANTIVVSDASPIAGMPPGTYNTLGNDVVLDSSGRLYNPETGYLVGSSSSILECMNYLLSLDMLSLEEIFKLGFHNPLQLIGVDPSSLKGNFIFYHETEHKFICTSK
ncbi:amidohydrolase family protein [Aliifodinibius sp. S!AR15-10]|uniref:N-acetylglucosamine-6-phosphate deacetylase n=1 Tax=Aliifodinibius sp. S!AR15-10 TaxID=2950437 RepID=UPI0028652C78|nr:hypothetical protein [Aliifodinibius sp. S!AR15-10]MDR8390061.1 amidohydrolase family protein [Aliifodinibius sp. S!AR15-10]